MASTILQKQTRIQQRLKKAHEALNVLQSECPHTSATKKAGSSTGNYDPSQDGYWWEWKCPECGKFWTTE